MITASQFLDGVRKNVARVDRYELGQDGRNGACDCIGLIIGALRLMGETWNGTHGSNYAARNEMQFLRNTMLDELRIGHVVYKARWPGDEGYDLPTKYKGDPEQKDFYHVGVVTGVNPLEITHCTGVKGGIKRDSKLGNWSHYGALKKVEMETEVVKVAEIMMVTSDNGGPVYLRPEPNKNSGYLERVPVGTLVEVTDWAGDPEWARVILTLGTVSMGYMMREYLKPIANGSNLPPDAAENVSIALPRVMAEALLKALQTALK